MTTQEAKDFLRSEGYFVDNLWHVTDVQDKFECTDEEAQDVLYWVFSDYFINELINNKIYETGNDECLEEKEEL
jgi:hypothetical protein